MEQWKAYRHVLWSSSCSTTVDTPCTGRVPVMALHWMGYMFVFEVSMEIGLNHLEIGTKFVYCIATIVIITFIIIA